MTDAEWLTSNDPPEMLKCLEHKATLRKLRLFACGCCRRIWGLLGPEARTAVEVTEKFSDGQTSEAAVESARASAHKAAVRNLDQWYGPLLPGSVGADTVASWHPAVAVAFPRASSTSRFAWVAFYTAELAGRAANPERRWGLSGTDSDGAAPPQELQEQAALVRDVFGNPFGSMSIARPPRTVNVLAIAQAIYDDRAFDRMPILADALEDAGCNQQDILCHLRDGSEHCRGCWSLDLVLGKA